jgi:hypothetical protein
MLTQTPRDPEPRSQPTPPAPASPTPSAVGTFAAGQSPLGRYEVTAGAPVGCFACGLMARRSGAAGLTERPGTRTRYRASPRRASYKERVRLGELLNKAIEKRRTNDGKEILEPLRPLAEAVGLEPPEDELMVAHLVFLLKREQVGELDATLEEIAQERAELMRFRLIGPMPAYNFIEFQEPAWA